MAAELGPYPSYRVLLVDDSDSYRAALGMALARDRSIQIIGEAADGKIALELIERLHPDVVLMDVIMPRLDGIETARIISGSDVAAVVLMSIIVRYPEQRGALNKVPLGSIDLTDKPVLIGKAGEASIAKLIQRLKTAVHNHRLRQERLHAQPHHIAPLSCQLIAIAASTGGMEATRHILMHLPSNFPPVVIAQHVDPEFAERFAALLQNMIHRPVTAVQSPTPLYPGHLYVASHHHHIQVRPGMVHSHPAQAGELAPSADSLFFSVSQWYGETAVGIILTGMGEDGALGLKSVREAGGWTIAQDDRSALVYGMPRAAFEVGACREVLPLTLIGERLANLRYEAGSNTRPVERNRR